MWLLLELIIVVGLVGLIMLEVFDSSEREAIEAEGRRIAAVVGELQEGVDAYLADTGEIATCFNLRGVVTDWIDGVDARTRSGPSPSLRTLHGGNTPGREASVWHPVELFATAAAPLAPPTTSNYDGARRACNTGPGYLPSGTWYLPSLASAGLLPPALDGLRYSTDPSDEYWGRYSLRFRLWVRYVNAVPASTSPESGYKPVLESLLVVGGDPLPELIAQATRRALPSGAAGLISSRDLSDPPQVGLRANVDVVGTHGGWTREICADAASLPSTGYLSKGGVPLCSASAFGHTTTVSGADILRRADILPLSTAADFGFRRARVASGGYISGAAPADPPQAVIALVSRGAATDALARALHRTPTGDPALHRMHTELHMGGFGVLNTAFVGGIDDDGDGYPNYGVHVVGPNPSDKAVANPNVVHGDLVVTGNLQVGCDELSFGEDTSLTTTSGGTKRTTGNVHACGSMLLGEDGTFYGDELRPERTGSTDIASGNLLVAGNTQHGLTTASRPKSPLGTSPPLKKRPDPGFDDTLRRQTAAGYNGTVYARRSIYAQETMAPLASGSRPASPDDDAWDRGVFVIGRQLHLEPPGAGLDLTAPTRDTTTTPPTFTDAVPTSALRVVVGPDHDGNEDVLFQVSPSHHLTLAAGLTADDAAYDPLAPPLPPGTPAPAAPTAAGVRVRFLDAKQTTLHLDSRPSGYAKLDHALPAIVPRALEQVESRYPVTGGGTGDPDVDATVYSAAGDADDRTKPPPAWSDPRRVRAPLEDGTDQDQCPEGQAPVPFTTTATVTRAYSGELIDDYVLRVGSRYVVSDQLPDALATTTATASPALEIDPGRHEHRVTDNTGAGGGGSCAVGPGGGSCAIPPHDHPLRHDTDQKEIKLKAYSIDSSYERDLSMRVYQHPWTGWSMKRKADGTLVDDGATTKTYYRYEDPDNPGSDVYAVGEARGAVIGTTVIYCVRLPAATYKTP